MFEYHPSDGRCLYYPHVAFKRQNTYEVLEKTTSASELLFSVYVMQCTLTKENVLVNNDFGASNSLEGEI